MDIVAEINSLEILTASTKVFIFSPKNTPVSSQVGDISKSP